MVIFNTVSLGLENTGDNDLLRKRIIANNIFTYIFIVELVLKVYAMGPKAYAQDKMNLFDALIVVTSILELLFVKPEIISDDPIDTVIVVDVPEEEE